MRQPEPDSGGPGQESVWDYPRPLEISPPVARLRGW